MLRRLAFLVCIAVAAPAERLPARVQSGPAPPVEFREEKIHGRGAFVLDNGRFRIAALSGGGHLAEIRLVSDDPLKSVNPMRVPHYPTIDPHSYDPARHDPIYGTTPHRWLSSGYMGHLLCFPLYGPPSAEEAAAGLGNHGEAPIVEWRTISVNRSPDSVTLRYAAGLPKTQFRVERAVTLERGALFARVEEWIENLAGWDRPINWMQHATFGLPFVEPGRNFLDMSATRGMAAGRGPEAELSWPARPDLRPFPLTPNTGSYRAFLLDRSRTHQFFALYHSGFRIAIGYLFPAEGHPWIADWQENRSNRTPPWNGEVVARGIEFGSSPFAEGLRRSVERGSLFGVPAYRWIGARGRLKTEFLVFVVEIPEGFQGVRDVVLESGAPVVISR